MTASHSLTAFDPSAHRESLVAILREIDALERGQLSSRALHSILRRHPRQGRGFFSRSQLIAGYRAFASDEGIQLDEPSFIEGVRLRPVRTQSGVTPITVFTKPFPCPGKCIFCPNDVRMPKSYLSDEPGCQRASANRFDPYLQTYRRLMALRAIGHPTDKVEIIVLGGTWSFYPEGYQRFFVARCFQAMNDFGTGDSAPMNALDPAPSARKAGPPPGSTYNMVVTRELRARQGGLVSADEEVDWTTLERLQRDNESAACRNVGLCVETRPDHVDEAEVMRLRRLGCTKVQIGLQSLSDRVLSLNQRGHDLCASRRAMTLLRAAGFKIHAHWMANLFGSTPDQDKADFARMFADPDFRPDELKVYPCSLIETAELMDRYRDGSWQPYAYDDLSDVLQEVLVTTPRYCRLSRVVRDIPSQDIVDGNRLSNFRQIAQRAAEARGCQFVDIRSREIKLDPFEVGALQLKLTSYEAGGGREHFIEYVTDADRLVAFARLHLPGRQSNIRELTDSALLREVHVYGAAVKLGDRGVGRPQHSGLGRRLVDHAARLAREAGHGDLAVISAVGTRGYYRRLGFVDGELYQHLALTSCVSSSSATAG